MGNYCYGIGVQPSVHATFLQLAVPQGIALEDVVDVLLRGLDADGLEILGSIFLLEDSQEVGIGEVDSLTIIHHVLLLCCAGEYEISSQWLARRLDFSETPVSSLVCYYFYAREVYIDTRSTPFWKTASIFMEKTATNIFVVLRVSEYSSFGI